jgi:hypothetical protein
MDGFLPLRLQESNRGLFDELADVVDPQLKDAETKVELSRQ